MTARFTRAGTPSDAVRIAAIYNQGIEDRVATFETEPRTAEHILKWFTEGYPVLVAGEGRDIHAYAVAFPYRSRPHYEGVREFSVYVARDARGKGFGKMAVSALIDEAKGRGWWKLLSRIFPQNTGTGSSALRPASGKSASTRSTAASMASGWIRSSSKSR